MPDRRWTRSVVAARLAPVVMAFGLLVGGAGVADAAPPPKPGQPVDSGYAVAPENGEITIVGTAPTGDVSPLAVVNVGGGTWSYGSGLSGIFKSCWSNYVHPSRYHSSTAVIANQSVKRYANAGAWSYAQAEAGIAYQCNAYWNTY